MILDSRICSRLLIGSAVIPNNSNNPDTVVWMRSRNISISSNICPDGAANESTIDTGKWTYISGAESNTDGIGEPSAPYSLNLDGKPSGGDQIQTHQIDLSAQGLVSLAYYYERRGGGNSPESGEDLWVDYRNASGIWVNLAQYAGSGPDMTAYEYVLMSLPPGALHSTFQLRWSRIWESA